MFSEVLGYKIFNGTKEELISYILSKDKIHIVSGNPEVLYSGLEDNRLYTNFTSEQAVIIPDGIGTILASKVVRCPIKEKLAGIEVMSSLLDYCRSNDKSVYLLGSEESVLLKCVDSIRKSYSGLKIVGFHNGYFDLNSCEDIITDIQNKKPFALFVAMGAPRQESFIVKYMESINCSIFMGVGGSFDIYAGKLNRAPKWMINLGIEWLYRIVKEPCRVKRLGKIPRFLFKVIKSQNKAG